MSGGLKKEMFPLRKAMETRTGSTRRAPHLPCNFARRIWREKPTTLHRLEDATVGSSDTLYSEIAEAKASVTGRCSMRLFATTQKNAHDRSQGVNLSKLLRKHLRQNMRRRKKTHVLRKSWLNFRTWVVWIRLTLR